MITFPYNFQFHEFISCTNYKSAFMEILFTGLWIYINFRQQFDCTSNYRLKYIHFKQNLVAKSWKFIWILKMTKIKRKQRRRNLKVYPSNRWSTYFFVLACQVASNWHQSMKFPSMRIWDFLPKMAKKYFLLLITDVLVSTCIMYLVISDHRCGFFFSGGVKLDP